MAQTRTAFGRLLDALRTQRVYIPTTRTFPSLDVPATSEQLRLAERAEENGRENRPAVDAQQPDRVESEIIALIQDEYQRAVDIYRQDLENYDRRIYGTSLESLGVEIGGAAQDAVAEYTLTSHKARDELTLDRKDLEEAEQEFEDFKRSNRLRRGCRTPEGHITSMGIILLIVVLDTLVNGYFLSGRDEFGLLGGMMQAIIVAGMNVAFGFFAGRIVLPFVIHRSLWRRLGGSIAFLILLCLILSLNLSFAHYRDLSVLGVPDPEQHALSDVLQSPLTLHDVKSWWLAGVGVLFSFIALIDGFKWDDPYPGYAEVTRRRDVKRENYLDRKHYWLEQIKERREQARAEVGEIRHETDMIQGEIAQASLGRRSFTASFFAHITNLEAAGNQLIGSYRDTNRKARTTSAPSYFEQRWHLTQTEVPVSSEIDRDLIRKQVEGITASLSDALNKIHKTHDETIHAFDHLDGQQGLAGPEQQPIRLLQTEPQSQPFAQREPTGEG